MQLERNLAWRGSFRLLRNAAAIGFGGEFQKMRRYGRGGLSG